MQALHYKNITLTPNKCIATSRSLDCDTSIDFCGFKFKAPIVPANMASVINEDIAKWLAFNNFFYIYHRFGDTAKFIQRARAEAWPLVSISVGVQEKDRLLIEDICQSKCRVHFITIDIAHGFADSVAEMIGFIKSLLPDTKVIAGNVWGDENSIEFLQDAGADAIKVGLSCGAGCSTYNETGFGSPMFSAAQEAGKHARVPIILDGGVRENADIAKALVGFLGWQEETWTYPNNIPVVYRPKVPMVMAGSIFAACINSPGETVEEFVQIGWKEKELRKNSELGSYSYGYEIVPNLVKKKYKVYYGSASEQSKISTKQEVKNIEGKTVKLECNGLTYEQKYQQIIGAIQSQISYAGGKNLLALKDVRYRTIN
jgi:GMP reductase